MSKGRNSISMADIHKYPPAIQAQIRQQLGDPQTIHVPEKSVPRALQPMKDKHLMQQKRKGLNKLESSFFEYLKNMYRTEDIVPHGLTFLLGNNLRYTPDFACFFAHGIVLWETKGPFFRDDAKVKLKAAASKYHRATFYLVQKIEGQWRIEKVLP